MFWHRDETLLPILEIDVGKVDIVELHAANLLQLLLHPATGFQGIFQALPDRFLAIVAGRTGQFQQARHGPPHGDGVALIQVVAQPEPLVDGIREVDLAHFTQVFGQIIDNQPVLIGEELRPHFRNFPARDVGVEAIKKRRIDHGLGEWGQQMRSFDQGLDTLVDVADEDHRSVSVDRLSPPGKRPRSHVILHDLDTVMILEGDARHLVERHGIPKPHQAHLLGSHVVEQIGDRGLTPGHQNAVRADLLVYVALAGSSRTQLAEVVVVFHQRNHAGQQMPFHPFLETGRLHARGSNQCINPEFLGKRLATLEQARHIHVGHLNRLQIGHQKRRSLLVLFEPIMQGDDAPDAAHQQLFILAHEGIRNFRILHAQIGEQRLIHIALFIQFDGQLVDDLVAAAFTNLGLDLLRLIGAHIILGQDALDVDHAGLNGRLVIGRAIHPQQILQHIDRDVGPFLDQLGEILANYFAAKVGIQQGIDADLGLQCFSHESVSKIIGKSQIDSHRQANHFDLGLCIPGNQAVIPGLVVVT